jgi:hypothetical protein
MVYAVLFPLFYYCIEYGNTVRVLYSLANRFRIHQPIVVNHNLGPPPVASFIFSYIKKLI